MRGGGVIQNQSFLLFQYQCVCIVCETCLFYQKYESTYSNLLPGPNIDKNLSLPSKSNMWTVKWNNMTFNPPLILVCVCVCVYHEVELIAWISLTLSLHLTLSSIALDRLNYIQCPHRANVNKFLLVSQHWHVLV